MKLSIIIPTFNEAGNIKVLIERILSLYPESRIIIVDDGSPDGTANIAAKVNTNKVIIIRRLRKMGLGSAICEGVATALRMNSDLILTMDGDFSHDPVYILEMLKDINSCDVVIGSRYVRGGKIMGFTFARKLLSRLAQFVSVTLLGLKLKDSTSNFRLYKKEVLRNINIESIKSDGYSFLIELIWRVSKDNYKIKEIPIIFKARTEGKSKISGREILKAMMTVIRLLF